MYQQPDPYRHEWPPAPVVPRRRRALTVGAAALVASAAVLAVSYANGGGRLLTGSGSVVQAGPAVDRQGGGTTTVPGTGQQPGTSGGSGGSPGLATAAQQVGVVDINTVLTYQGAAAAGTGIVLTASGDVLTNNHVVSGATSISVRVVTTGATYRATVVGTDPTEDVAVIRLQNAAGLQPANLGDSGALTVGAAVTGVGNAGGTGGTPSAAAGTILALDQALTASDESTQSAERLTGMIESDAPIEAGDSGGPLYDAANRVIGMDTAASANRTRATVGYAIPIARATTIARQIEAGRASATVHLGYPGFLGVSIAAASTSPGALVSSALAGGPAAQAGIGAGDVITSLGGTAVDSASALHDAVAGHRPGQRVAVTWQDAGGATHHSTVTLAAGPAD